MAAGRLSLQQYMPARDRNGRLVAGARMRVWLNGTTTDAAIFTDATLTTPLANPVIANASGRFVEVWVEGGTAEDPVLFTLSFSGASGETIGNPSTFDDVQTSIVYGTEVVEAAEAARDDAIAAEVAAEAAAVTAAAEAADAAASEAAAEAAAEAAEAAAVTVFNANTTAFTRSLLDEATAAEFRQELGAQAQIYIDLLEPPYNAVFDGRDNTTVIQQALTDASTIKGAIVLMPDGTSLVSSTLIVPSGVSLEGEGRTITRLYKTTNYGPLLQLGTSLSPWQGGRISDFWMYHDYGTGPFPPSDADLVTNPSGSEAILDCYGPYNGEISNIWATGSEQNIRIRGGVASLIENVATVGVYDPQEPVGVANAPGTYGLQFTLSGLRIDKGPQGQLPTNLRFVGCHFGGTILLPTSAPGVIPATYRSITWPDPGGTGPHTSTDVTTNIGPQRVIDIRCCEAISFIGCYFGSGAKHNIALNNTGDTLSGFSTDGCFMDAAFEEMVAFEGTDSTTSVRLDMHEWAGQTNSFGAVTDKNYTGLGYSARGVEISGLMRGFVGPPIRLAKARRVTVNSDIGWFNVKGFYTALTGYNCAVHLGATAKGATISGLLGGDNAGDLDPLTVVGVNITAGATLIDTVGAADGGVSGALVVGGFKNTAIRIEDAPFTLTQRSDACFIEHLGVLTANRTITLSATGARDGDTWSVTRGVEIPANAFTLTVMGVDPVALANNQYVVFRYNSDANRIYHVASGTRL